MTYRALVIASILALSALALPAQEIPPAADLTVDFDEHVRPILAANCYSCHGEKQQQAGLRLDRRQPALRGGDYGPVILQGDGAGSKLVQRLVSGDGGMQMPPTGTLEAGDIAVLRAWIDQGAEFGDVAYEVPEVREPVDPAVAELIGAVRRHDQAALRKLLSAEPGKVNGKDEGESTALHHAAGFGTLAAMELLIEHGARVDARNREGSTPLHWAVADVDKVWLLLDHGADIDAQTERKRTPVALAAMLRFDGAPLRLLLDEGADPNLASFNGRTPLMEAARWGDVQAMKLLLAKGADASATAGNGAVPLFMAAASRSLEAVQLLKEHGADVNASTKRNQTPIFNASSRGAEDVVRFLLEEGARVDLVDYQGHTPLTYAAMSESMSAGTVRALLDHEAPMDVAGHGVSGPDESPQDLAGKRGDTEVARLLGVSDEVRGQAGVAALPERPGDRTPAEAVRAGLALLELQSPNFLKRGGCNSCHAQSLPAAAAAVARERGLDAPGEIAQIPHQAMERGPERIMNNAFIGGGVGYELLGYAAAGRPADAYTDALIHYIKRTQEPDGHWASGRGNRPPLLADDFIRTALSVRSILDYGREVDSEETQERLDLASRWLSANEPVNTQERTFHLLGLKWTASDPALIDRAAKSLAATQREDGGFAQLPTMGSDAYATGQALYALGAASGMDAENPIYRKGVSYLLRTQAADGSWHVKSRALPLQPYFESGFPYGADQWISASGTSWAAMALALAAEPTKITRR